MKHVLPNYNVVKKLQTLHPYNLVRGLGSQDLIIS